MSYRSNLKNRFILLQKIFGCLFKVLVFWRIMRLVRLPKPTASPALLAGDFYFRLYRVLQDNYLFTSS